MRYVTRIAPILEMATSTASLPSSYRDSSQSLRTADANPIMRYITQTEQSYVNR